LFGKKRKTNRQGKKCLFSKDFSGNPVCMKNHSVWEEKTNGWGGGGMVVVAMTGRNLLLLFVAFMQGVYNFFCGSAAQRGP